MSSLDTAERATPARNQILVGDAASVLHELPDGSVDMVLTSPPYFRLRDYQITGQLGAEEHVDDWVEQLHAVTLQMERVLGPDGSLWLNLGDSYATHPRQGAAAKSLLLGPERLALQLVHDGWHLRNKLVWHKTNPVPTSVTDRLASSWEVVYVLTRSPCYFFDLDSLRLPHRTTQRPLTAAKHVTTREVWRGPNSDTISGLARLKALGRAGHPLGKNPGDVWPIGTSRLGHGHHATFPLELAHRAIRAGCPEARCTTCGRPWTRQLRRHPDGTATRDPLRPVCGCDAPSVPGLVLDPFMGSGTTAVAAEALDRDWLGIELNPAFADRAGERIARSRPRPPSMRAGP